MRIRDTLTPTVLNAVTDLLRSACPDLTPGDLIEALRSHSPGAAPSTPEPLTTLKALCAAWGISIPTGKRLLKSGVIPSVLVSPRCRRIPISALNARVALATGPKPERAGAGAESLHQTGDPIVLRPADERTRSSTRHSCAGLRADDDGHTPVPAPAAPVGEGLK